MIAVKITFNPKQANDLIVDALRRQGYKAERLLSVLVHKGGGITLECGFENDCKEEKK